MPAAVVHLTIAPLPPGLDEPGRSAVTRELLRVAAAERTGVAADDIAIVARCVTCGGAHGRPELLRGDRPLGPHASMSRSGAWAAVAIADAAVGVDIERTARTDFAGFDEIALTGAEREAVRELAPDARAGVRAGLWTAKEALLKVSGTGLRIAPSDVSVGPGWDGSVVDDPGCPGRPVGLAAVDLTEDAGYQLAVALAGDQAPLVRVRRGPELSRAAAEPAARRAIR